MWHSADILPDAHHQCQATSKQQAIAQDTDRMTAKTHCVFTLPRQKLQTHTFHYILCVFFYSTRFNPGIYLAFLFYQQDKKSGNFLSGW